MEPGPRSLIDSRFRGWELLQMQIVGIHRRNILDNRSKHKLRRTRDEFPARRPEQWYGFETLYHPDPI